MVKIAIVDYGMGNLRSVEKACQYAGYDAIITDSKDALRSASHIILPGVGAVKDAVHSLHQRDLWDTVIQQARSGKPFLGICLGMQMLFEKSFENGEHDCLALVKGQIVPFHVPGLRVPHIGWNNIRITDNPLFQQGEKAQYVYFVHSYHGAKGDSKNIIATANYGYDFIAAVREGNIYGTQFHPEKSGETGIQIIKNFGGIKS